MASLVPDLQADAPANTVDAQAESRSAERAPMPLPDDIHTVFLGGLFGLAALAALYAASEIILPIVLAIVLKLLLQPVVRGCERLRLPRAVGSLVALVLLIAAVGGLGVLLSGPATAWAIKLPDAIPALAQHLKFLAAPASGFTHLLAQVQGGAETTAPASVAAPVRLSGVFDTLFSGTKALAGGLFTMLLVLFYLLVSGETFLRRLVEILPRFKDKRRAVEISLHIETDVSAYLFTITGINLVVGVATGFVMWVLAVGDPLLWGVVAFGLNFVPILGPLFGAVLFAFVGVLSLGVNWAALLPAALYFTIHLIEGEAVTPMLLARRFTINPVALVLGLVFWYWMWGVPGAILAVPLLAITKIVCDDVPSLRAFGHFLEG